MKIALINPPARKILEFYDAPPWPHIGLGYLAAYLRRKGFGCEAIDAKLEKLSLNSTISRLNEMKPDFVGITAFTHEVSQAVRIASAVKENSKECFVVLGGVHTTFLPVETLEKFSVFDAVVFGEGEKTLYQIVNALSLNYSFEGVDGVAYRGNDGIRVNKQRSFIDNLDDLPFPTYDLFPKASAYIVQTGRGCPYQCNFCSNPWTRKTRFRSPQNVIQELIEITQRYGRVIISFADETFGVNRERTEEILDLIITEGLNKTIRWWASTRVDAVDHELLVKMKQSGSEYLGYGVESGNEKILKATGKGIDLKRAGEAIKLTRDVGIRTGSYFILGHPFESPKTALDTINFAAKLNTDSFSLGIMVPYPGSRIFEMAKKGEGGYKIISDNWDDFNKQYGNALELEHFSRKKLELFQLIGYLYFYLYNLRIKDLIKIVKSYSPLLVKVFKKIFILKN
jgi:anaerobic magnesium-protoporphyrin IX monomethyl ester cyclase